ncbi:MAG: hypothetical protein HYR83_02405 [Planctomycetes bacterium]|nr:hypothetical protein [Planctomycetota bacterium]
MGPTLLSVSFLGIGRADRPVDMTPLDVDPDVSMAVEHADFRARIVYGAFIHDHGRAFDVNWPLLDNHRSLNHNRSFLYVNRRWRPCIDRKGPMMMSVFLVITHRCAAAAGCNKGK